MWPTSGFIPQESFAAFAIRRWKHGESISRDSETSAAIEAGLVLKIRSSIDFQKAKLLALQSWMQCSWKSNLCLGVAAFAYTLTTPAKKNACPNTTVLTYTTNECQ